MIKITSIMLSFVVLIQSFNFDLNDIPKLAVLANHIVAHIEEGEDLSDFISQHYGIQQEEHSEKHEEHQELPFKHQHLDAQFNVVFIIYNEKYVIKTAEEILNNNSFHYKEKSPKLFAINFFQPPKVA